MKIEDVKVGMRVKYEFAGDTDFGTVTKIDEGYVWCTWESDGVELHTTLDTLTPLGECVAVKEDIGSAATNKYSREIAPGVFVDVYDVLRAFNVTDPCLQHLVKKALAVGQRGHKDVGEDLKDILASAKRAVEMNVLWRVK